MRSEDGVAFKSIIKAFFLYKKSTAWRSALVLVNKFQARIRQMPASLFGTFFAVYHNDVGRKVNVAVKQAAANRISVNRYAGCFKFADACRVKAAGNDNFLHNQSLRRQARGARSIPAPCIRRLG